MMPFMAPSAYRLLLVDFSGLVAFCRFWSVPVAGLVPGELVAGENA